MGKRKRMIGSALVLFVVALLYWSLTEKPPHIPFYGVWRSSDPPYGDCYMEITPEEIVFGKADNTIDRYRITKIEEQPANGKQYYTVHYADQDGDMKISFDYQSQNHGEIRIKNQEHILWTPSEPLETE